MKLVLIRSPQLLFYKMKSKKKNKMKSKKKNMTTDTITMYPCSKVRKFQFCFLTSFVNGSPILL